MKRVSSEKKPCSRPSSARTSPSRSPSTNVLPSRTLRVRSDTRECSRRGWEHDRSKGMFVGGGNHVGVAILAHPGSAVPRSDPPQAPDCDSHLALVVDE